MENSIRRIFFGCNYNDKRIKGQFDALKKRLEARFPIDCVVIDKRSNKSARDMWKDIRDEIQSCGLCFFDVTAFRPNVILELGYALAVKDDDQVFITWRKRMSKGKMPPWLLTNISHLARFQYTSVAQLDRHVDKQLLGSAWMQRIKIFNDSCAAETSACTKYKEQGLEVCLTLRDNGAKTGDELKEIVRGSGVHFEALTRMMKSAELIKRTRGNPSKFYLLEE